MEKKDMTTVIVRCLNGDSFAQEELVLAVQQRVYYHCRKMLKDEDRAFDLTQDVLMAMLTKLDTLQNPESFWSWLGGITANLCRNAINRGPREVQIPEDEDGNSLLDTYETLDEQTIPDKALDNDETRRMIAELVDDLPEAQRQCVLLFYYNEMSVKDIAASMDVSENTVKSRLNYARKSIKEGVERYEKQGIKLYGFSPLPFLLFFLRKDALACSMTAEQATQLARQVVQGVSATAAGAGAAVTAASTTAGSSAAGGSAVGGSAAGAAAGTSGGAATVGAFAAAKAVLAGLSTKVIAGITAGVILAGSVAGVTLTGGNKSDNDDKDSKWKSMEYVALPKWVDEPFDQVGGYFLADYVVEIDDTSDAASNHRTAWYSSPEEDCLFTASATLDSTRIMDLNIGYVGYESPKQAIGWMDIHLGDSFESVLSKLGITDVPEGTNVVTCDCYEDGSSDSKYIDGIISKETESSIHLWYFETEGADFAKSFSLNFRNNLLHSFFYTRDYPYAEALQQQESPPADNAEEEDPILLTGEGVWVDQELDICYVEFLSDIFGEYSIPGYSSVAPDTSFTVTNVGSDENAHIRVWVYEYKKSSENDMISAMVDGEEDLVYEEIALNGRYYNPGNVTMLTNHSGGRSAGSGLYWEVDASSFSLQDPEWIPDGLVCLYPGQSATFQLPENDTDTLYELNLAYIDPGTDLNFPQHL